MRLPDPPRRMGPEPLMPMIDVVFFLVVFFMIVSRFTNAEPFAVARPAAAVTDPARGEFNLFLSSDGEPGIVSPAGAATGAAALRALDEARAAYCGGADCDAAPPPLLLHADAAAPGAALARLLPQVAALGFGEMRLITVQP